MISNAPARESGANFALSLDAEWNDHAVDVAGGCCMQVPIYISDIKTLTLV